MIPSNDLLQSYKQYENEFKEAALRVLDSGYYILGNEVKAFEKEFASYLNMKYCVGLANGLDALTIILRAVGLQDTDAEVIVPANTYIATILGITENHLKPVFVEPDEFFNIDTSKIEEKISDKTKVIMPVNLYGQACNMKKLREIADKYNLLLIEDSAQSHGAKYDDKFTNEYCDASCFSFYPTKNLGAFGDAGAIVTNSETIAENVKMIRNYGSKVHYQNDVQGVNSRLDEMQAALLRVKLSHFDEILKEREKISNYYLSNIHNEKIKLPQTRDKATHVWHLFVAMVENRDKFIKYMEDNNIKILIHYPIPPHLSKAYVDLGYKKGDFPITEKYATSVVTLPLYNGMPEEQYFEVARAINAYK